MNDDDLEAQLDQCLCRNWDDEDDGQIRTRYDGIQWTGFRSPDDADDRQVVAA